MPMETSGGSSGTENLLFTSALNSTLGSPIEPPTSPSALIESFQKLMLHSTPAAKTVEALRELKNRIEDEIGSASERESSTSASITPSLPTSQQGEKEEKWDDHHHETEVTFTILKTDESIIPLNFDSMVEHYPEAVEPNILEGVRKDLNLLLGSSSKKYSWVSAINVLYSFGQLTLQPRNIHSYKSIVSLLTWLSSRVGCELNSCLITQYKSHETSLGWHQDNEDIFDPESPILNLSLGSSRTIEFRDKDDVTCGIFLQEGSLLVMKNGCQQHLWHRVLRHSDEATQQTPRFCLSFRRVTTQPTITEESIQEAPQQSPAVPTPVEPVISEIVVTPPDSPEAEATEQPAVSTPAEPVATTPPDSPEVEATEKPAVPTPTEPVATTPPDSPEVEATEQLAVPTPTEPVISEKGVTRPDSPESRFHGIHSSRFPPTANASSLLPKREELISSGRSYTKVPPLPSHQGYQQPPLRRDAPPPQISQVPPPPVKQGHQLPPMRRDAPPQTSGPKHLIIGDSMVKGLPVGPEVLILSRGGGHPKDIVDMLIGSTSLLPKESYSSIETLALCVGTNALEWSEKHRIPLLQVLSDYNTLVGQLREMFPRAVIGLCNVMPRQCRNFDMNIRIVDFNDFCRRHVAPSHERVIWIEQSNKFLHIDYNGDTFLKPRYYGKDFLHLSHEGKLLMLDIIERAIFSFKS